MPMMATKRNGTVRMGINAQKVMPRPKKPSDSLRCSKCSLSAFCNTGQANNSSNAACCKASFNLSKAAQIGCKAAVSPTKHAKTAVRRVRQSAKLKLSYCHWLIANNTSKTCNSSPKTSAWLPSMCS